jgi:hypothetical protein
MQTINYIKSIYQIHPFAMPNNCIDLPEGWNYLLFDVTWGIA